MPLPVYEPPPRPQLYAEVTLQVDPLQHAPTGAEVSVTLNEPVYRVILGFAYQTVKRNVEAEASYKEALKQNDKLVAGWVNLGSLYAQLGKKDDARTALKKALALDPGELRAKALLEDLDAPPAPKK